jgi:DHA1 family bicyclomycin/chloramphenicol resistance-like MFS transporter
MPGRPVSGLSAGSAPAWHRAQRSRSRKTFAALVVARAVVVDVAKGDLLAKVMSIMMALGGLAPMVAPVLGGTVLTLGGTWRTVFWFLVGFGLLMMITAIVFVPESLPRERRHGGGLRQFASGLSQVLRIRLYVGYMLRRT